MRRVWSNRFRPEVSRVARRNRRAARRIAAGRGVSGRRLRIERLESRRMLTTFTVNSTSPGHDGDPEDGFCDTGDAINGFTGICTFEAAVEQANFGAGLDQIHFNLAGAGIPTITFTSRVDVTAPVIIDGTTQSAGKVEMSGGRAVLDGIVLSADADNSVIRGLVINRFRETGLTIAGDNTQVVGNFIGTDATGMVSDPDETPGTDDEFGNAGSGVLVLGENNVVGGIAAGDRNVISGNASGVSLIGDANWVIGNYIGTDLSGANGISGQRGVGIRINGDFNTVGGALPAARNVVVDSFQGVLISGGADNRIEGNYIGVDVSGLTPWGNATSGVGIQGGVNDTDGGSNEVIGNVIADNDIGVELLLTSNNTIDDNVIGLDADFLPAGNRVGVFISGSVDNQIGGENGNTIAANLGDGVVIAPALSFLTQLSNPSTGNLVLGNVIGNDGFSSHDLGNGASGVRITGASLNAIGGALPGGGPVLGNLISGNGENGVRIHGLQTGIPLFGDLLAAENVVQGNWIGTDGTGRGALGNGFDGVWIGEGAAANRLGGEAVDQRNVISGNQGDGVLVSGVENFTAQENFITGNFIGTTLDGDAPLPNEGRGIHIDQHALGNEIGGADPGQRNVISGNHSDGVVIAGTTAIGNKLWGNFIGVGIDGESRLPNGENGVFLLDASSTEVGSVLQGEGNTISANLQSGVRIEGASATNNVVLGNAIGVRHAADLCDPDGIAGNGDELGNGQDGVVILGASDNVVGQADGGNVIACNARRGVSIQQVSATGNRIQHNRIGTNQDGGEALPNGSHGVEINAAPLNIVGPQNLISGNRGNGVLLIDGAEQNQVVDSWIGLDATGTKALPNGENGVEINDAIENLVGGSTVSGNVQNGILIRTVGGGSETEAIARLNTVHETIVGLNVAGTAALPNGENGIEIRSAADNRIGSGPFSGNLISGNQRDGVFVVGPLAIDNVIAANSIGVNRQADAAIPNGSDGVEVRRASQNILHANLVSGNLGHGVLLQEADDNRVRASGIGIAAGAVSALSNAGDGVRINDGARNTVGGLMDDEANRISGNRGSGVAIFGVQSVQNDVLFNAIGLDANGGPLGNDQHGVHVREGVDNRIGTQISLIPASPNTIAFNAGAGVFIEQGVRNKININATFENGGLGIDLNAAPGAPDGVTLNDDGDSDSGGNQLQNFPELLIQTPNQIGGQLNSLPNERYLVSFYHNDRVDPSNHGEGQAYLGAVQVTTDENGDAVFLADLPTPGGCITSIAQHLPDSLEVLGGDTSEFSECVAVPELLINEVDYDQPGANDVAEFIELVNAGPVALNLDGLELRLVDGSGGSAVVYQTIDLPSVVLAPGDYFVISGNAATVPNTDLVVSPAIDLLRNGAPAAVSVWSASRVVDTVSYEGDTESPYTEGSGTGLLDDGLRQRVGISRIPDRFDSQQNNLDFRPQCITPGEANVACAEVDIRVDSGVLRFDDLEGTANDVLLTVSGGSVEVRDAAHVILVAGNGCVGGGAPGAAATCALDGVVEVNLQLGAGDDNVQLEGLQLPVTLALGEGDDTWVATGSLNGVTLDGGAGTDTLRAAGELENLDFTDGTQQGLTNLEVVELASLAAQTFRVSAEAVNAVAGELATLLVRHAAVDAVIFAGDDWRIAPPVWASTEMQHRVTGTAAELRIANTLPWLNPLDRLDSSLDNVISPLDILVIFNWLNSEGAGPLPVPTDPSSLPPFYYDPSGDNLAAPNDPLPAINFLNNPPEAESFATQALPPAGLPPGEALPAADAKRTSRPQPTRFAILLRDEPQHIYPSPPIRREHADGVFSDKVQPLDELVDLLFSMPSW